MLAAVVSLQDDLGFFPGSNVPRRNDARVLSVLHQAAEAGDVEAYSALGYVYQTGALAEARANMTTALFWLERAASAGSVTSRSNLAALLLRAPYTVGEEPDVEEGEELPSSSPNESWNDVVWDPVKAKRHLKRALVEAGTFFLPAEYNLAMIELFGWDRVANLSSTLRAVAAEEGGLGGGNHVEGGGSRADGSAAEGEALQELQRRNILSHFGKAEAEEMLDALGFDPDDPYVGGEAAVDMLTAFGLAAQSFEGAEKRQQQQEQQQQQQHLDLPAPEYTAKDWEGGLAELMPPGQDSSDAAPSAEAHAKEDLDLVGDCSTAAIRLQRIATFGGKWVVEVPYSLSRASSMWVQSGGLESSWWPDSSEGQVGARSWAESLSEVLLGSGKRRARGAGGASPSRRPGAANSDRLDSATLQFLLLSLLSVEDSHDNAAFLLERGALSGHLHLVGLANDALSTIDVIAARAASLPVEGVPASSHAISGMAEDAWAWNPLENANGTRLIDSTLRAVASLARSPARALLEAALREHRASTPSLPSLLTFWPHGHAPDVPRTGGSPLVLSHSVGAFHHYLASCAGEATTSFGDGEEEEEGPQGQERGLPEVAPPPRQQTPSEAAIAAHTRVLNGGPSGFSAYRIAGCLGGWWGLRGEGVPFCASPFEPTQGDAAHAWFEVASRGSSFAPATFARALAHADAGNLSMAWRLLDVAWAQDGYADLPVAAGKLNLLASVLATTPLEELVATCARLDTEPPWPESWWSSLLDLARGGTYLPPLLPPKGVAGTPMNRTELMAAIAELHADIRRESGDKNMDTGVQEIYNTDVNGDGLLDERDWAVSYEEFVRQRAREREVSLGPRYWVGALPLSGSDRRLCGALSRSARAFVALLGGCIGVLSGLALGCYCLRGPRRV